MDVLPQVLAKSARAGHPAESLTSHLRDTLHAAAELRRRIGQLDITDSVLPARFWTAVLLAALAHDAGKLAAGFQDMLGGRARSWGERHEVVSLGFLPGLITDESLRNWVASAVVTHHRPLSQSDDSVGLRYGSVDVNELRTMVEPVDGDAAEVLAGWLTATAVQTGLPAGTTDGRRDIVGLAHLVLQQVLDEWELPVKEPDRGLTAVLLQGAVTLADHLSSAHGRLHSVQPVSAQLETLLVRQLGRLHDHQVEAGQTSGHLLLRAPTGSGKTEAGLLWAATQVGVIHAATGGTARLFYTLPYLASINAMTLRLGELLGDHNAIGVAHSRSASYHLTTAISTEDGDRRVEAARKAVSRAAATRLFRETVRVGTPYQLLRGALAGAAHSGILIDSANSVFVLDELHAYDARRLGYILAMARLWERLGGRIAVLSATLPTAVAELIGDTLDSPVTMIDAGGAGIAARHRVRLRDRHLTAPDTIVEIRGRLAADQAVLVVANNVADAQALMDTLGPVARERHGPGGATLLHSRFKRGDRSQIEKRIHGRYGVDAGSDRHPGLVVATQVVEVSLNVDFDVLFTSAAPLEALLQRFGRVNRLGKREPADVIMHEPAYRTRRGGSGEYADGIYPREPVEFGWHIMSRHADEVVDEVRATGWLDEVYATPWGKQWRADVQQHHVGFQRAFLAFEYPFGSRNEAAERFDELFEGTEAILSSDREAYEAALEEASSTTNRTCVTAAGRVLGEEYLIPMPFWADPLTTYERRLSVRVVNGDYDPDRGLLRVRGIAEDRAYQPGEVL